MLAENTDSIFWGGLLAFDAVPTVPAFVHYEADLGGEATGGGLLQFVHLRSKSKGVVVPVGWEGGRELSTVVISVCDVGMMAGVIEL